jgi:Tfp pilus assembly protein FimT/uncharacterized membrane protein
MAVVTMASVAVPNFSRFIDSSRERADIQQMMRSLVTAHSEAVVRASPVILTSTAGDWAKGWRIWVDLNASDSYYDGDNFKVAEAIKTSAIISAKLDGAAVTNITFDNQGFIRGAKLVLISYRSQPRSRLKHHAQWPGGNSGQSLFAMKIHFQKGVFLVEVLIAVLVAATGVLGASALQLNAVKFNQIANVRSTAVFLAQDITDRMRVNRELALRLPAGDGAARNGRVITVTVRRDESRMSQSRLVAAVG